MRRRNSAIALVAATPAANPEAEVLGAYDARRKLQAAIEAEKGRRETAEVAFVKATAKAISSYQVVNVDYCVQRHAAGKTWSDRAKQRSDSLQYILEAIEKWIEKLKTDCADVVNSALTKRIEVLEKTLAEKKDGEKGVEEELKLLKAEVSKLQKSATKKSSS